MDEVNLFVRATGAANVGKRPYSVDRVVNEAVLVMEHIYPVECALPGPPYYKGPEDVEAENRRRGMTIVKPVTAG